MAQWPTRGREVHLEVRSPKSRTEAGVQSQTPFSLRRLPFFLVWNDGVPERPAGSAPRIEEEERAAASTLRVEAGSDAMASDSDAYSEKAHVIGVLTILGVLLIQYGTHALDKAIETKKSMREIVSMMYRELMILGVVAFGLFVIESSEIVHISDDDKHVFEEVHLTLFLVAVIYGLMIVAVVKFSYQTDRVWNHYESLQTVTGQWQEIRENFERLAEEVGVTGEESFALLPTICRFVRRPWSWMNYKRLLEHVRFHELRQHFIRANHMPRNFAFAGYLKKCKQHVLLELVEVHSGAWVIIAWLLSLDLFLWGLDGAFLTLDLPYAMCLLSAVSIFFCAVIYAKIDYIYWCLLHSEFIHFDVNRGSLDQFMIASSRRRGHQESLFWLGNPSLLIDLLQFVQFVVSVNLAVVIQNIGEVARSDPTGLAAMLVMQAIALTSFCALLPIAIPKYTMATHVGEFVDRELLSEALKKQQRRFKSRALPPSLRQAFAIAEHEASGGGDPMRRLRMAFRSEMARVTVNFAVLLLFFVVSFHMHWLLHVRDDAARRLGGSSSGSSARWSETCDSTSPEGRCYSDVMRILEIAFASVLLAEGAAAVVLLEDSVAQYFQHAINVFEMLITFTATGCVFAAAHLLKAGGGTEHIVAVHACGNLIILRMIRPLGLHLPLADAAHTAAALLLRACKSRLPASPREPSLAAAGRKSERRSALALDRPLYLDAVGSKAEAKDPLLSATPPAKAAEDGAGDVELGAAPKAEGGGGGGPPEPKGGLEPKDGGEEEPLAVLRDARLKTARWAHTKHMICMQIWQDTLRDHPEMAAAEGKFSVPILRAMLGLPPYEADSDLERHSDSGTISDTSSSSGGSAIDPNMSGYDEESDDSDGAAPRAAQERSLLATRRRRRRRPKREGGAPAAALPGLLAPLRRLRGRSESSQGDSTPRNIAMDEEDTEEPIPPSAGAGAQQEIPRPVPISRAVSLETRMFNAMVSGVASSNATMAELQEGWEEEKYLCTVLRVSGGFKRAPPELPDWRAAQIVLTRKELLFIAPGEPLHVENGVLYDSDAIPKRLSLNTVTKLELTDHRTVLRVRTPYMTLQLRGQDADDTAEWHREVAAAVQEANRF